MADGRARASWLDTGLQIAQFLAIVGAGTWAFYTFVLKENAKTHHIIPSVDVRALGPSERGTDGGKFRAFELGLTVNNASERDVYIIAGIAYAYGHKAKPAPDGNFNRGPIDTKDVRPQLMMRPVIWSGQRDDLGVLITFPSFDLARAEKAMQQYVFLVPSAEYDILEIWMDFHVVDACPGIFGLQSCFEFAVEYNATASEFCIKKSPCIQFHYRKKGRNDWNPIREDQLRGRFSYKDFQTTRMIIPPDAPILKISK